MMFFISLLFLINSKINSVVITFGVSSLFIHFFLCVQSVDICLYILPHLHEYCLAFFGVKTLGFIRVLCLLVSKCLSKSLCLEHLKLQISQLIFGIAIGVK